MKPWLTTLVLALAGCAGSLVEAPKISPSEVDSMLTSDPAIVVLDVRTEEEFNGDTGHLQGAILIPVQALEERIGELEQYRSQTIVAYCRTGGRSTRASRLLKEKGFRVFNMEGGITRWREEDRPVVVEPSAGKK